GTPLYIRPQGAVLALLEGEFRPRGQLRRDVIPKTERLSVQDGFKLAFGSILCLELVHNPDDVGAMFVNSQEILVAESVEGAPGLIVLA
ncbi:MAG TPA: hypothetical protein VMM37_01695, partial [Bacteroidota bacterium]|nr:hypothetical protein [Bacteroidota bacterium]